MEPEEESPLDSEGDPRVHFAMNLVLSSILSYIVLWGLDLIDALEFSLIRLMLGTIILMGLTQVLVLSD
jgi:hypothetical protein